MIITAFCIILTLCFSRSGYAADLRKFLPPAELMNNWKIAQDRMIRTETELFHYIDGGAELYRAFNFRYAAVREFEDEGLTTILVEIFEFKTDADAFGMYKMLPGGEKVDIGDDAYYEIGVLRIWKGPYYIRIYTTQNYGDTEDIILRAGKYIDEKITVNGEPPKLLNLLPKENLASTGGYYFHEYIALQNIMFISTENIFSLNRQTEVVFGEYRNITAEMVRLLLIKYSDEAEAEQAFKVFLKKYLDEDPSSYKENYISKMVEPVINVRASLIGRYMLVGFEDEIDELLKSRFSKMEQLVRTSER